MAAMLAAALVLSVVVRVYDAYGVLPENLSAAKTTVDRILKEARVSVAWTDCPCDGPAAPRELVLRIAASTPSSEPDALGFSYVDVQHHRGTLATVFGDRIGTLAANVGMDRGELLGRAIAHGMSHLLLGTHDHEARGLMRGYWSSTDLANQRPDDWTLLPHDRLRIRQAIAHRLLEGTPPATLTADADAAPEGSAQ